jgi:N-acetylglucosaminyldiphosphoundecaprenol N-acetyl-beta-D-mannosaminyltransferase
VDLDGIKIYSTDFKELRNYFYNSLVSPAKPKLIITFNLDFYRNAMVNNDFSSICRKADLILPDGIGIIHLLKIKYNKKLNRITGNDLFEMILKISSDIPLKIAFVGSTSKVLETLVKKVNENYPNCIIAAAISPVLFFENIEEENNSVLQQITEAKPDVLFLALGNPRQELWLHKYKDLIGAKINIGVGAVFDFYSGNKKRSPSFFQKISLEWAWRLVHEPKRLSKRYLVNGIPFFLLKALQIILKKNARTEKY